MSAPASKPFDLVIGWQPLVEEIVAAACLSDAPVLAMKAVGKEFKQEQLDLCKGKRVLVCGSYFSVYEIVKLACCMEPARLTVWLYSDKDVITLRDGLMETYFDDVPIRAVHVDRFTMDKFAAFPRATRLLRRSLEPDADEEDEPFYRGMMHNAVSGAMTQEAAIKCWLSEPVDGGWKDDRDIIATGHVVILEHQRIAADIVQNGSVLVTRGELKLRVVVSGRPLVMAVADEAAKGMDVGILVRYDLAKKRTAFVFATHNKTDMASIWTAFPDCHGSELKRLVSIGDIIDALETPARLSDNE